MRDLQGVGFRHTQDFSQIPEDLQGVGFKGFYVFTHTHTQKVAHLYYRKKCVAY